MLSEGPRITENRDSDPNSRIDGGKAPQALVPGRYEGSAEIDTCLLPRQYTVDLGVHHQNGTTADWVQRTFDFTVLKVGQSRSDHYPWPQVRGHVRAPARWRMERVGEAGSRQPAAV